jgi:uncharacterized protein (DUF488 family)
MGKIRLFTIGFTKKTAEYFFSRLCENDVKRVIDVRLNNVSQLAGFAKKNDLQYFLKTLGDIDYMHLPELAPDKEILDMYRKNKEDWSSYEKQFLTLLARRRVEEAVSKEILDGGCLLCSEDTPDHCHRRLVAEYLKEKWGNIEITHII